ncbi:MULTISPECIES: hypothetical protein [unclassified Cupriavidus]|uniref:DUF6904 family protein n=1 Tax=unclassified Cupriavidus TaxID=2640874 RepID=UPI00042A6ECA|nr:MULTISPECIES: hypothetical protein [unclassified Cupriavidus]MBP0630549.1 hypothetical protein [Cupriavidus sp. AcVe19-1a]MBP0639896.1 hypothetical protein [Cupriavidus sp. AcVe19-6a]
MLAYQLLNNHAGLLLIGDYASLRELHEVVHDVNDRSPLIREEGGAFLGLAYDVRKAYEQQRENLQPPEGYEEIGVRYGVQILWPVLLVQQRMLRVSLGYLDHSRRHQAITYALEAVIEAGLREDFGAQGQTMVDQWLRLDPTPDIFDRLNSRGAMFCSWSKAERERRFASLLLSFDTMYEHYSSLPNGQRATESVSPRELEQWKGVDWPDPCW